MGDLKSWEGARGVQVIMYPITPKPRVEVVHNWIDFGIER